MDDKGSPKTVAGHGVRVVEPAEGRPVTIVDDLSYATCASAARQADFWNTAMPVAHLVVAVGPRNDAGRFPLIWKAA